MGDGKEQFMKQMNSFVLEQTGVVSKFFQQLAVLYFLFRKIKNVNWLPLPQDIPPSESGEEQTLPMDPVARREQLDRLISLVKTNIHKIGVALTSGKKKNEVMNFYCVLKR